ILLLSNILINKIISWKFAEQIAQAFCPYIATRSFYLRIVIFNKFHLVCQSGKPLVFHLFDTKGAF
ncbi:MAG: hypothetical protein DRH26_05225, partial [Deltaproteobacteria bacterium]